MTELFFKSFDTDVSAAEAGTKWTEYLRAFDRFCDVANITTDKRQISALLHFAGEEIVDIYETVRINKETEHATETEDDSTTKRKVVLVDTFAECCAKLTAHFNPKRSKTFERHMFRRLKQMPDENTLKFVTRCRTAARYCEFENVNEEIKDQVITFGSSEWLTKKALGGDEEPTLESLMKLALSREVSYSQAKSIKQPSPDQQEAANFIGKTRPHNDFRNTQASPSHSQSSTRHDGFKKPPQYQAKDCGYCGKDASHSKCPAYGTTCTGCGKKNHWVSCCRSKDKAPSQQVPRREQYKRQDRQDGRRCNFVDEENVSEFCFDIGQDKVHRRMPKATVTLHGHQVEFVIDTGSTLNIIDIKTYNEILHKPALNKPICNAFAFESKKPINFMGRFHADLKSNKIGTTAQVHVLKYESTSPNILSYDTAYNLGMIQITNNIRLDETKEAMKLKYPSLFSGKIGCLKDYMLDVKPSKRFHYRIPYHLKPQVEKLLNERVSGGLIEKCTQPTTWISACHVVPKKDPSQIRLVIDARPVNKAIIRHRHVAPTLDDIAARLKGSKVFSKVDFKEGYRQVLLHPKSRHLTTFSTHMGLFQDTRLSPGLNAGAEYFQLIVSDVIKGIDGVMNVSDDIIFFAKNDESHDRILHQLLSKLDTVGFTLNLEKSEFKTNNIDFFGVNFSADGMAPSTKRVEAFQMTTAPETASEVRSVLATANYSTRFINNFATIIAPLRELTQSDSKPFVWLPKHQRAFEDLKKGLTTNKLAYFNPAWHTEVICDASPVGLGAILVQVNPEDPNDRVIIAFASRTLSKLERKYSQVELEALVLIFAVEKFHMYVYGKKFKLYSDAKAIVFIYGGMSHKSPARIERWGLRLLPYDFELIHTPGEGNPADFLSRHPLEQPHEPCDDADLYVNFIIDNSMPVAITRNLIAQETLKDQDLQDLITAIRTSNRQIVKKSERLVDFNKQFDYLNVSSDGIILRRHQIVVPTSLRQPLVDIAHEGHLGIVKTKQLMRVKVWFPRMDQLVERRIGNCLACQACTPSNNKNMIPMQSEPVPDSVWHTVAGDFFGPLPSGHYLLGMICKTSGYPIVEVLTTTSARATIPLLDKIFSEFGIPKVFCSDNGPPFQGHEFSKYMAYLGTNHQRSTPLWPRGNAKIERFMKNLGKTVRIAQIEGKPWKQALNQFLRSYRAAPHGSTNVSPNQLIFGRNLSSRLPSAETQERTPSSLLVVVGAKSKTTLEGRNPRALNCLANSAKDPHWRNAHRGSLQRRGPSK